MFWKKKKAKAKDELVSVETEEEFHAALNSGADVELTHELAEKIGLMAEDVGTLEDIKAAKIRSLQLRQPEGEGMAKRPPKRTYRQRSEEYAKQVSSEIIEQIKKGTAPWQKPWKPGEQSSPSNLATGKAYTGGNSLYLMSRQISEGRGDNRWGTYRQIEAAGGQVRRGEKGTTSPVLPEPDGATGEGRGRGRSARTRRAKRSMRKRSGRGQ